MHVYSFKVMDGVKTEGIEVPEDLIIKQQDPDENDLLLCSPDLNKIYDWAIAILGCESCYVQVKYWSGSDHDTTEITVRDSYSIEDDDLDKEWDTVYFNFDSYQ